MIIPVGGVAMPVDLPVTPMVQESRQSVAVDDTLTIEADSWYRDVADGVLVFEGGVKAKYGPTVLQASRLFVNTNSKVLRTEGTTRIIDPEGELSVDSLEVNWETGVGSGKSVRLEVGYVLVQGGSLEIQREPEPLWTVRKAQIELTDLSSGGTRFAADELVIQPGRRAVARRVFYELLGINVGPFPSQTFNLDRRVSGFKFPSVTNRRGVGIGVSWESSFLLSDRSVISGAWNSFPGRLQEYQFQYTQSFIDGGQQITRVAPRGDLGERVSDGWFNNVSISHPDEEFNRLRDPKASFSAGTYWNTGSVGRRQDSAEISKAWDFVYEKGGALGQGGWIGTGRIQRVRDSGQAQWVDRAVFETSYIAPRYTFGNWNSHARLDLVGTLSGDNTFGIIRGEIGAFGEVIRGLTVGGVYVNASETGSADFLYDRLPVGSGFALRADYVYGPYTLRYLRKYDFSTKDWYDVEWEIALAAGSLEPFVTRREFPSDYRIGVRFRVDGFTNRLVDRDLSRKNRPD